MKVRTLLISTSIVSSILGAVVAYLVLTVPNDLAADALMKRAHDDVAAGLNDRARATLLKVVQQYPRTDAAAAATVALITLADQERQKLAAKLSALQRLHDAEKKRLDEVAAKVTELANAPPKTVVVQAPAPKKAPKKQAPPTQRRR